MHHSKVDQCGVNTPLEMVSPIHHEKRYRHSTYILSIECSKAEEKSKKEGQFTTQTNIAQHWESGACCGCKQTFRYYVNLKQGQPKQRGFKGTRVLLPSLEYRKGQELALIVGNVSITIFIVHLFK